MEWLCRNGLTVCASPPGGAKRGRSCQPGTPVFRVPPGAAGATPLAGRDIVPMKKLLAAISPLAMLGFTTSGEWTISSSIQAEHTCLLVTRPNERTEFKCLEAPCPCRRTQ